GREEVKTDHGFRALHGGCDLVNVERGGVRREDRALLHNGVELCEDFLLDLHILEDCLNHEITIGNLVHVERAFEQAHALLDLFHREAALFGGVFVILADDRDAPVERFLLCLHDGDGNADIEEVHGNAAAHRTGTDNADLVDGDGGRVGGHIRNLPGLTLGKEDMALGSRLRACYQLAEELLLDLDTLIERQIHRRFDALDVIFRCEEAPEFAGIGLAEILEDFRLAARGFHFLVEIADLLERALFRNDLAGESHRTFAQLAFFGQLIDEAHLKALLCADMGAACHHFERLFGAYNARQTLRAASAGEQAEIDFRQAAFRGRDSYAVMAGECHFEAAAKRGAVNGSDDGL